MNVQSNSCKESDVEDADFIDLNNGATAEANDLLKNGILVETSKGLVCISVNDAQSSNLNLSVEDLRNVARQLILQQNVLKHTDNTPKFRLCESDGFSSECSDSTYVTSETGSFSRPTTSSLGTDKSSEESDCTKTTKDATFSSIHQVPIVTKKKGRGGWPKGRKRKPELLNLPPKAPATGYNLYLNEQRSFFKESKLPFYEITKIIGNRWSSLTLEEKKPYLDRAEEEKKRYREELKQYRQSDAYRSFLNKKRKKKLQNNVLSESDMDATDDFDEEDNEELYCRTCDQWFHSLHNKREHLQAKKHLTTVAGDIHRELKNDQLTNIAGSSALVDESSLEGLSDIFTKNGGVRANSISVEEAMSNLTILVCRREQEIKNLCNRREEAINQQKALLTQLIQLNVRYSKLQKDLSLMQEKERDMESKTSLLWQVPSWFVMNTIKMDDTENDNNDNK